LIRFKLLNSRSLQGGVSAWFVVGVHLLVSSVGPVLAGVVNDRVVGLMNNGTMLSVFGAAALAGIAFPLCIDTKRSDRPGCGDKAKAAPFRPYPPIGKQNMTLAQANSSAQTTHANEPPNDVDKPHPKSPLLSIK
jgi:hypothetical protein